MNGLVKKALFGVVFALCSCNANDFKNLGATSGNEDTLTFRFGGGNTPENIHYLLVIDNSSSMTEIIQRVRSGLSAVIASKGFPVGSVMGVMNTVPGDPDRDFSVWHKHAVSYEDSHLEPGFLSLVNADSIRLFRQSNGPEDRKARWALDGCSAWFSPLDANCMNAHTQNTLHGTLIEAGVHALAHAMQKAGNEDFFNPGANVNVVFISDTHDPGASSPTLEGTHPSTQALVALMEQNSKIASVRFHALVPIEQQCNSELLWGKKYLEYVSGTNGVSAHMCDLEDYTSFFAAMVDSSENLAEAVFTIPATTLTVSEVSINGQKLEPASYTVDYNSGRITFPNLNPAVQHVIEVAVSFP